ncbi:hypothetical protein [Fodinibius halophilus]|uniref:Uncharacterized protein n=1 Tax=Fodinibius halophilus TaxID=1736908 RepID=A0A6M1T6T6_9BACT|nr:hypothetical protein [Fodinibius halophilus]NGP89015.1 hypothetical protein [Fodinibius halophilus]
MKRSIIQIICICVLMLFGITACDTQDGLEQDDSMTNITSANQVPGKVKSEASANGFLSASGSSDFSLEITPTNTNLNGKAKKPGSTNHLLLNGQTSDPLNVTGNLQVTKGSASPASDLMQVNPTYRAYQDIPETISYSGNSVLSYTINGTSYSTSLTTKQQDILADLQQKLDEARTYGDDPPKPCPRGSEVNIQRCIEKNSMSAKIKKGHSLKAMTDQQVKQWLKEQGYKKVKAMGNRKFQVTKVYSKKKFGRKMSITSIFNAKTEKMGADYSVSENGKTVSRQVPAGFLKE